MSKLADFFQDLDTPSMESFDPLVGENVSLFYQDTGVAPTYRLFMDDFMPTEGGQHHRVCNELLNAPEGAELEIRLHSNGGSVDAGCRLLNVMQNQFPGRTTGILESKGYSMGAMVFSHCDQRIVSPYSRLMYHNYSTFVGGKGGEIKDTWDGIEGIIEDIFRPIVDKGFLTEDEYERLRDGKDFWMGAKELCERGIATHVNVDGTLKTAAEYLSA